MFDNNRLQQLQRRSRAPAKATCSQQSGIHIEPYFLLINYYSIYLYHSDNHKLCYYKRNCYLNLTRMKYHLDFYPYHSYRLHYNKYYYLGLHK